MATKGNAYPFSKLLYTSDNKNFYYNSGSTTVASPTGSYNKFFSFTTGNFNHIGELMVFCQDDGVFQLLVVNGDDQNDPKFLEIEYQTSDGANPVPIPLILPPLTQLTGFCVVSASPNTRAYAIYNGKTTGTIRQEDQELISVNTAWANP